MEILAAFKLDVTKWIRWHNRNTGLPFFLLQFPTILSSCPWKDYESVVSHLWCILFLCAPHMTTCHFIYLSLSDCVISQDDQVGAKASTVYLAYHISGVDVSPIADEELVDFKRIILTRQMQWWSGIVIGHFGIGSKLQKQLHQIKRFLLRRISQCRFTLLKRKISYSIPQITLMSYLKFKYSFVYKKSILNPLMNI